MLFEFNKILLIELYRFILYYSIDYCLAPKLVFGQTIKLPGQFQSTFESATSQHQNLKECKNYFDLNKPQQTSNLSKNKFFRQQFNRLYGSQ